MLLTYIEKDVFKPYFGNIGAVSFISLPLEEIPLLGEMGAAQNGCRSCKEKVSPPTKAVTDEVETLPLQPVY